MTDQASLANDRHEVTEMGETENLRHCIEKGPQLLNACDLEMQSEDAHALMELLIVHDPSTCAIQAWIRCCSCSPLGH